MHDPNTRPYPTSPDALVAVAPRRRSPAAVALLTTLGTVAAAAVLFVAAYTLTSAAAPPADLAALPHSDSAGGPSRANPPRHGQDTASATASATASPTATGRPSAKPTPTASVSEAAPFSVIVDNGTSGRFTASGNWKVSSHSPQRYGADYLWVDPVNESDAAWYRVDIPRAGKYRIEVWYPTYPNYNSAAPYVVVTASGNQKVVVNQRVNGGSWVSLGTFTLAAGDHNVVGVSRWTAASGPIIADAIRVSRG